LQTSGKYNEPAFGGGQVYVGTDRIQAFGPVADRASAMPANAVPAANGGVAAKRSAAAPSQRAAAATPPASQPTATAAAAGAAATPAAASTVNEADAATLYAQRCAACHDDPQGNIPPRRVLATRSHERIVQALSTGVMRAPAAGLSAEQIEALARYLKK
jgi:mono/diheme cytochrome c family protein